MGLNEAINVIMNILKQVMEDKLSPTNIEIVTVTPDKLYHMLDKDELQEVSNRSLQTIHKIVFLYLLMILIF